ncbi:MAG: hypothetical protein M3423_10655 [Actinomycetota bacterium]|nr:hypothetical protein [Nocardioidaceae bacterium]MDQ3481766.1 hypothetical protein [Actinomycetota bacterium]
MVTEATKKFRDVFAYGLLGVAALYLLSGLSLLFKSEDEVGPFSQRAALFGHVFTHPLLVLSLLGAVLLAVGFGAASKNAKLIVTAALAIAAAALLFALISWFSGFGADSGSPFFDTFGGVPGAGKIVSILLGLAQLLMLGLTAFFAYTAFQSLPKSAKTIDTGWSQGGGQSGQGYSPNQGYGPGPGYPQGAAQGGQGQWQSPQAYGDRPPGYGYQPQVQPTWEQAPGQPSYPPAVQQHGGWEAPQETQTQPSAYAQNWGQPPEAEAAPEQRPGDATQASVAYPVEGPQWGAPPSGAHEATPAELTDDGNAEGAPPPPQHPGR